MSTKHAAICTVSEPINPDTGMRTQGHSDRTGTFKNGGNCIRRWCHHILDLTGRCPKAARNPAIYETATGAKVNMRKSGALALGAWDTTTQIMDIPYYTDVKSWDSTLQSEHICQWDLVYGHHTSARPCSVYILKRPEPRHKDTFRTWLSVGQNVVCSSDIPPPAEFIRQLNTTISWFIWRREIFRVPLSTLQRGRYTGSGTSWMCGRIVEHYLYTEYKHRVSEMGHPLLDGWRNGTYTPGPKTPQFPDRIPASREYLRSYIVDVAHIPGQGGPEAAKAYKKRLYTTLQTIHNASFTPQEMRIARMWPQRLAGNMEEFNNSSDIWQEKLCGIGWYMTSSRRMRNCTGSKCPLQTTARNVTTKIPSCTVRVWRSSSVGMDKKGYSKDVAHDPGENPQRMAVAPTILPVASGTSTCGTIGFIPIFNIPNQRGLTLHDLMDFLRRYKWKMYQSPSRHKTVANFLAVLDTTY